MSVVAVIGIVGLVGYLLVPRGSDAADPATTQADAAVTTAGPISTEESAPTQPEVSDPPEVSAEPGTTVGAPPDSDTISDTQRRAAGDAERFLRDSPVGRRELIRLLVVGGDGVDTGPQYSYVDATIAVDSLDLNWDELASEAATTHIEYSAYSRRGLIAMLASTVLDFTAEQAINAVDGLQVDWAAQPARYVQEAINGIGLSREGLLRMMTSSSEQFEPEAAEQAIDAANIDWNAEAVLAAQRTVDGSTELLTCEDLIAVLTNGDGGLFTQEQATHGATSVGAC